MDPTRVVENGGEQTLFLWGMDGLGSLSLASLALTVLVTCDLDLQKKKKKKSLSCQALVSPAADFFPSLLSSPSLRPIPHIFAFTFTRVLVVPSFHLDHYFTPSYPSLKHHSTITSLYNNANPTLNKS